MDRTLFRGLAAALVSAALTFAAPAFAQTPAGTAPADAARPAAAPPAPAAPGPASPPAATTPPTTPNPSPKAPDASTAPPATPTAPPAVSQASSATTATPPATPKVPPATPEGVPLAPGGKPQSNEIEPNAAPTVPETATTENVDVPARPIIALAGQSSYDDAFKSIRASLETVRKAMDKDGLKPLGHPITVFSAPDDKGFRYQAGFPVAQKPDKAELGNGVVATTSPAGKAIKFQHRGAYDDIDATYDVITAFLDAKGLQVDSPYIEEYLTDLTTPDDPNLQVDIYVFVK